MNGSFIQYKHFVRSFFCFITTYAFVIRTDRQTDIFVMANTALHSMHSMSKVQYTLDCLHLWRVPVFCTCVHCLRD